METCLLFFLCYIGDLCGACIYKLSKFPTECLFSLLCMLSGEICYLYMVLSDVDVIFVVNLLKVD